ncbi:MAG: gliding motility-associated C-terminal domain-containing protein, partial [bacterium]|nr:gliding motility-associated C-terminal domain-containing protein [bacterium]
SIGQLTFTSTTGTGPFSLIINGVTYNGITSGTAFNANPNTTVTASYTLSSITDANTCPRTTGITGASATITVNPNVTPTFTQVPAICSGGSLSALPTTSSNSITGTWSPALNNTATTTYTFTPTSGQCATTASMTISVNPNVTPTFTQVPAICSGGSLSALPTTSSNSITGTWSPALNNAATTTYTFTPTVGQCATTASMTIIVNPLPTATINPSSQIVCYNNSASIGASGTGNASVTISYSLDGINTLTQTKILNGPGTNLNGGNFIVGPITTNTTVTLTSTSLNGCAITSPQPTVTILLETTPPTISAPVATTGTTNVACTSTNV